MVSSPQVLIVNYFVSADWLVDRRHCNLKWQNAVKDIREKINAAIQDMPENEEIKQLLSGSCRSFTSSLFHDMNCNIIVLLAAHFTTAFQVCLCNCFASILLIDIHYFHCLRIVEILKGTEASSKNIFGRYSSQRMKVTGFSQQNKLKITSYQHMHILFFICHRFLSFVLCTCYRIGKTLCPFMRQIISI